jgi:hypothetical protein
MELVHIGAIAFRARMELEAHEEHFEGLRAVIAKSLFVSTLQVLQMAEKDFFGFDVPEQKVLPAAMLTTAAEKAYAKVVEHVTQEKADIQYQRENEENRRLREQKDLLARSPA